MQAILQHYGWRSFFLDFSASAAVSAWFAGHVYKSDKAIFLAEDCHEDPVLLVSAVADYEPNAHEGHLYVVDRDELARADVKTFDLSGLPVPEVGGRFRFATQSAWLVGPLRRKPLPSQAIMHHIKAPASVFREYAVQHGLAEPKDLFPSHREDPYYAQLLSLPWRHLKIPDDRGPEIPVFVRGLELPEYGYEPVKRLPPDIALFDEFWVFEYAKTREPPFSTAGSIVVPDTVYFGSSDIVSFEFPHLTRLLKKHQSLIIETEGIIRFPEFVSEMTYGKGLFVVLQDEGVASIADLVVDQAGLQQLGCGANFGWHYSLSDEGAWLRRAHEEDCPCGNHLRHLHHQGVMQRVEELLADGSLQDVGGVFRLRQGHELSA